MGQRSSTADLSIAFCTIIFQAPDGSSEADEMEVLVTLVEAYERKHYPIDAIQYKADEGALTKAEFKQIKKIPPKARGGSVRSSLFK